MKTTFRFVYAPLLKVTSFLLLQLNLLPLLLIEGVEETLLCLFMADFTFGTQL